MLFSTSMAHGFSFYSFSSFISWLLNINPTYIPDINSAFSYVIFICCCAAHSCWVIWLLFGLPIIWSLSPQVSEPLGSLWNSPPWEFILKSSSRMQTGAIVELTGSIFQVSWFFTVIQCLKTTVLYVFVQFLSSLS